MSRSSNTKWTIAGVIVIGTLSLVLAGGYIYRHDIQRNLERSSLPPAIEYSEKIIASASPSAQNQPIAEKTPHPTRLPAEINLAVPFTPQAPHANWDEPYKEFCEEASVLMVMRYIQKQAILSPEDADAAMLAIKTFEDNRFGYYKDTNAVDTAAIITEYFDYDQVKLVDNPTADDIRSALASGKPVIVPAAGRLLGNPYFQSPGPLYHMFVIKGYTKDGRFVVNDPGTRRGADFLYSENTIMNALHDWRDDEKVELGRKVIIVIG